MLKVLLTVIVIFLACGYAIVLLRQLNSTAAQLAKLRQDLAKSDAHFDDQLKIMQAKQVQVANDESSTRNDENV